MFFFLFLWVKHTWKRNNSSRSQAAVVRTSPAQEENIPSEITEQVLTPDFSSPTASVSPQTHTGCWCTYQQRGILPLTPVLQEFYSASQGVKGRYKAETRSLDSDLIIWSFFLHIPALGKASLLYHSGLWNERRLSLGMSVLWQDKHLSGSDSSITTFFSFYKTSTNQ